MTKEEAKREIRLLSNGTLAKLTGLSTYKEQDEILVEKLEKIDSVDVSGCENWKDVWALIK